MNPLNLPMIFRCRQALVRKAEQLPPRDEESIATTGRVIGHIRHELGCRFAIFDAFSSAFAGRG
jgi:hypothetical protein